MYGVQSLPANVYEESECLPAFGRQRQARLYVFEASLVYMIPCKPELHSESLSQTRKSTFIDSVA